MSLFTLNIIINKDHCIYLNNLSLYPIKTSSFKSSLFFVYIEFQSVFEYLDHYCQFDLLILKNTTVRYSVLLSWPSSSSYFWVNRCVTASQYITHNFRSSTGMLTRGPGFKSHLRLDFPPPVTLCYYECFGLSKSWALKLKILKITF